MTATQVHYFDRRTNSRVIVENGPEWNGAYFWMRGNGCQDSYRSMLMYPGEAKKWISIDLGGNLILVERVVSEGTDELSENVQDSSEGEMALFQIAEKFLTICHIACAHDYVDFIELGTAVRRANETLLEQSAALPLYPRCGTLYDLCNTVFTQAFEVSVWAHGSALISDNQFESTILRLKHAQRRLLALVYKEL